MAVLKPGRSHSTNTILTLLGCLGNAKTYLQKFILSAKKCFSPLIGPQTKTRIEQTQRLKSLLLAHAELLKEVPAGGTSRSSSILSGGQARAQQGPTCQWAYTQA